jgi:hypothetical protein
MTDLGHTVEGLVYHCDSMTANSVCFALLIT